MKARRSVAVICAVLTALVGSIVGLSGPVSVVHAEGLGAGGEFHAVTPDRIFDSRPAPFTVNDVAPFGAKAANPEQPTFDIKLLDVGGIPKSDVLAVAVNITVTEPTARGFLSAFPGDGPQTTPTSIVNFEAGQSIANSALVVPSADGTLTIKLMTVSPTGTAHVVVDVFGWFSTSSAVDANGASNRGSRLMPINPIRFADTRTNGTTIGEQGVLPVKIWGEHGLPASGIDGVVVNITGITPNAATFISALPTNPTVEPHTSSVNVVPGQIKANSTFVPVGPDGYIYLYNRFGAVDVAVDVTGYLLPDPDVNSTKGRVVPLSTPFRSFDTRLAQFNNVELGPGNQEMWSFAQFTGSVRVGSSTEPVAQLGAIGNLTVASTRRQYATVAIPPTFLTVFPGDIATLPVISNLNAAEGVSTPNLALISYAGDKTVNVFNNHGFVHYLFDVSAVILG